MLIFIAFCNLIFASASSYQDDQFDKIIQVMETDNPTSVFGFPDSIDSSDPNVKVYSYSSRKNQRDMKIFIEKENDRVFSLALNFWVSFDAYPFLKNRFKEFQWKEVSIKSTAVDVIEERFKVKIPELGMTFDYNNQDPLRRPMWIYFK